MEPISWPAALAIVGSVGTAAMTFLKIFSMKFADNKDSRLDPEEVKRKLEAYEELKARVSVLENEIANLHEKLDDFTHDLDKLQDLFIKILSDKE